MTEAAFNAPTVLAATDFSPTAAAATAWAGGLATARGGRVCLVHTLLLHGPMTDYLPVPASAGEALQAAALSRLETLCKELEESGVRAFSRLEVGLPSEAIVATASDVGADLIVLGTRGLGGFAHLLLGSTAERVVQHAPCPVLTVHPGDAEGFRPLRSLLVPTDFSADAPQVVAAARRLLAAEGEARVVLLHAYHLPVEYTAYGTIPTALHFRDDTAAAAEERLAAMASELRGDGLTVDSVVREGYPPEVIVTLAKERSVDAIAMGTHGRSGLRHLLLGSNAERVVQHAPCPVLTVRRAAE